MTREDEYTIEDCEYQVGDFVIVSDEVKRCAFGAGGEMLEDIGQTFQIQLIKKHWSGPRISRHESRFLIQVVGRGWNYDELCFEPADIKGRIFDDGDISALFA